MALSCCARASRNIETSVRLCEKVDDHHRLRISPIEEDDSPDIDGHGRTEGLSGCVIALASLFDRLLEYDSPAAQEEFLSWPSDDDIAFARLRLWASGKPQLSAPDDLKAHSGIERRRVLGRAVASASLLVLARRWSELAELDRQQIESAC